MANVKIFSVMMPMAHSGRAGPILPHRRRSVSGRGRYIQWKIAIAADTMAD
jgi:hypothetical protein